MEFFLQKAYWDQKGIWGRGYFISIVGINEEVLYIYTTELEF